MGLPCLRGRLMGLGGFEVTASSWSLFCCPQGRSRPRPHGLRLRPAAPRRLGSAGLQARGAQAPACRLINRAGTLRYSDHRIEKRRLDQSGMLGTGEVRHPRLDRAGRRPDRIGAQQVGYRDAGGTLQYAGAKGTDFYDKELTALHRPLPEHGDGRAAAGPDGRGRPRSIPTG